MNSRHESAVVVAGTAAALIGAGLVYSGLMWQRGQTRQAVCISHYKQVGLASMQYIRDYDELTPPAARWSTVLFPYAKSIAIFQCPERRALPQGVAFHSAAAEAPVSIWSDARTVIWYFDSDGPLLNTADTGASASRPVRHPGGNTACYADGHVKVSVWLDFKAGFGPGFNARRIGANAERREFWRKLEAKRRRQVLRKKHVP